MSFREIGQKAFGGILGGMNLGVSWTGEAIAL